MSPTGLVPGTIINTIVAGACPMGEHSTIMCLACEMAARCEVLCSHWLIPKLKWTRNLEGRVSYLAESLVCTAQLRTALPHGSVNLSIAPVIKLYCPGTRLPHSVPGVLITAGVYCPWALHSVLFAPNR